MRQCERVFRRQPDTATTNAFYGGLGFNATRTYFTNFADDPWLRASIFEAPEGSVARRVDCDGCGHCKDLHAPADDDPPELKAARLDFEEKLRAWLAAC